MQASNVVKLPLGLQSFAEVRKLQCVYVDKTPLALKLIEDGKFYFLSRPRRFGKSLFLDTLRYLFEGERELFRGLCAEHNWQWSAKYPVIKLDMSGGSDSIAGLRTVLAGKLSRAAERLGLELPATDEPRELFEQLIHKVCMQHKTRVVLLIDEYDKPMIDNIGDLDLAQQMCKQLHSFYSVIKAADENLRFVMLTGVSKFAKVSIFSGLNNLEDISLNPDYGSICGYTEDDLNDVFKEYLQGVDRKQLRHWYNGYNFLGTKRVYNPHDILHFIKRSHSFGKPHFRSYWFESGTPTFVVDLIARDNVLPHQIEPSEASEELLNSSPIDNVRLKTILFQSGYLTIDSVDDDDELCRATYKLVCPNNSVRSALQNSLFEHYTGNTDPSFSSNVARALRSCDLGTVEAELKRLFASIANSNYRKNNIAHFEGYYAAVVHSFLVGIGLDITAEDASSHGYVDLTIQLAEHTYVVEFKVVDSPSEANSALQQIIDRGYARKYSGNVYQIGIEFSESERNITDFAWAISRDHLPSMINRKCGK